MSYEQSGAIYLLRDRILTEKQTKSEVRVSRLSRPLPLRLSRKNRPVVVMELFEFFVLLLVVSTMNSVSCHHHHRGIHVDDKKKGDPMDHAKRYTASDNKNVVLSEGEKQSRGSKGEEIKRTVPFSERRLEKMLEKAILKIITGDLSTGDMLLLKSLNYSLEEVLAIRERELSKKKDEELRKKESVKSWTKVLYGGGDGERKVKNWSKKSTDRPFSRNPHFESDKREGKKNRHVDRSPSYKDFDFEAYNRQAILDYENLPSNMEFQQSWSEATAVDYEEVTKASKEEEIANNLHRDFDRVMEPHVVFKIRYDDSEFDSSSSSDETSKNRSRTSKHHDSSTTTRHATLKNAGNPFHVSTPPSMSSTTIATLPLVYQLSSINVRNNYLNNDYSTAATSSTSSSSNTTTESTVPDEILNDKNETNIDARIIDSTDKSVSVLKNEEKTNENKKISEYEGLEWVEDDVYRVLPEFVDSLSFENTEENETSDYEDSSHDSRLNWNTEENENSTLGYLNDTPDSVKLFVSNNNISAGNLPLANLSSYLQVAIAHRRG